MAKRTLNVYEQCIEILANKKDYSLRLDKLFDVFTKKYRSNYFHNAEELKSWLQSSIVYFSFHVVDYYYCILVNSTFHSPNKIIEKAKEYLQSHHNGYTLSVLLTKMKENEAIVHNVTEEGLFSLLNNDSHFSVELRTLEVCTLTEVGLQKAKENGWDRPSDSLKQNKMYIEESGQRTITKVDRKTKEKKQTMKSSKGNGVKHKILASTSLSELVSLGLLNEREFSHCTKRRLHTVGNVKKYIEWYKLTRDSTRFTKYTIDIFYKIVDLLEDDQKIIQASKKELRQQVATRITNVTKERNVQYREPEAINQDDFIKEYYAEHHKRPLWFELFHAVLNVQKKTYHCTIQKALQRIDTHSVYQNEKRLLTAVRKEYQLHKDFYFRDEQPLSSWRNEQLSDKITESEFMHFVSSVFGFDVIELEQDEVMIRPEFTNGVKPIEREIRKCFNANKGLNMLILIDELLPIDIEPKQENSLKLFVVAWLKRHYEVMASGDSFWI